MSTFTRIIVSLLMVLTASAAWGQGSSPKSGSGALIVNIDNPNFRKLVAAVPKFHLARGAASPVAKEFSDKGAAELERLLEFSQIFNIMSDKAYGDLLGKLGQQLDGGDQQGEMRGVDLVQWKTLGAESLTIGEILEEDGGITIALRTVDIGRGQLILGKRYRKVGKSELNSVVRRYADLLLEAYTGKPGIFSSKVVFIGRKSKSSNKQVYICDFDGSNVVQITNSSAPHLSPQWSKDGRFITFTSYEDRNPDLFVYEVATGRKRKLSGRKGLNSGGNWSPGDKWVAFTGSVDGDANIFLTKPSGGERKLFIAGSGLDVDPSFSPDGKWLAYVSGRFGNPHIFVGELSWAGDNVKVVGDKRLTYAGWYNATPAWSPNSDKIAFAGYDKDINRFDIFLMNPDGSNMERLTIKSGDNERPTWSANGQLIMFQSSRVGQQNIKGASQLFIMNKDGSGQRKLETGLYEVQTPDWSRPLAKGG